MYRKTYMTDSSMNVNYDDHNYIPTELQKNGAHNITCSVTIPGQTNKSGYNITFYIDENYTNP